MSEDEARRATGSRRRGLHDDEVARQMRDNLKKRKAQQRARAAAAAPEPEVRPPAEGDAPDG